ncbi:MAG: MOSC domain-containing protein [Terriglobales bacterium]
MKLISVNVGQPRPVPWRGQTVATGIFKEPVEYAVQLRRLNLDGDQQADLKVHGGLDKAVYVYPSEHYEFWRRELPGTELPWGAFGENFTTEGLLEDGTSIGDRFRVGSAVVAVTQPRMPCYKLGIKFGRNDIVKRFLASQRTGFYFSVVEEGELRAGDTVELLAREEKRVSVADITRLYVADKPDPHLLRHASGLAALPANWRDYFLQRLRQAS